MTIDDLERRMPIKEFHSWQRYFQVWRFPDELLDLQSATLTSIVANIMRPRGYAAYRPDQFRLARRYGYDEIDETPRNEARALFGR